MLSALHMLPRRFAGSLAGAPAANGAPRAGSYACEWRSPEDIGPWREAWAALAARAAEPSPFAEAPALLPLLAAERGAPCLLLVRQRPTGSERLAGLAAFARRRVGFGIAGPVPCLAATKYAPLGLPLVDRADPSDVWDACLGALAQAGARVVVISHARTAGPVYDGLVAAVARRGGAVRAVNPQFRAGLAADRDPDLYFRDEIARKRRKEWKRLWRRFSEAGRLEADCVAGAQDVAAAFEEFLELEARGWKGRRGTALAKIPDDAAFARAMIAGLAAEGRCEIDRIRLDGRAVAMLVVLRAGNWAFTWKLAYDEAQAAFSPGLQVVLRATERLLCDPAIGFADSLAAPDHPLIDRVWRERLGMATLVVRTGPGGRTRARLVEADLRAHAAARRGAKSWLSQVRRASAKGGKIP